jgi:predicted outer membrane lipoprotein
MKYLEEVPMNLILGMDLGVFTAWIGTLLATVLCILYGLYYQFIKKSDEKQRQAKPKEQDKTQEEDL